MSKRLFGLSLVVIVSAGLFGAGYAGQTIDLDGFTTGITILNQDQNELLIQVDIGSVSFDGVATKEGDFLMMTVAGFTRSQAVGEPSLPMVSRILSVPFGGQLQTEIIESELEEFSLADLNLDLPLMPVQPPLSKSADPEDVPFEFNRELYQKSGYYSLPTAEAFRLGTLRSQNLGMLSVAPFAYDPVNNKIRVQKHLIIKITYLNADWFTTSEMQRRYYSPMFESIYRKMINYETPDQVILDDLVTYPVKYLIVSHRMFESQLQPFIEWKKKKGFNVIVAYTDVIGSTTAAIKNYIQTQYNNSNPPSDPAPSFVLLVGDTPQIPTWNGNAGSHITDLRYCEFTGDDYPEIYYGRFSARNTSELQPQIDKTLEYEQYTMPDPSYMAEVTLVSGVDYNYAETYGNGQINYGTNYYFNTAHGITDHTWLYPASDQPGASAAVIQSVSDGVGFANYTAHCGHTGWSDPSFTVSDIYTLTNAHQYLLGIGNCCLSNTFDESTPCFGEAWLQAANKGGVGYIGGSNNTYWDEDYWWGVGAGPIIGAGPTYEQTGLGAYDGVFHDHGEALNYHYITNSAIIFAGNMGVDEGGGHSQYYWEIYHLMGDPSVMNYMGVPSVNNISHANTVLLTATSFTVNADPGSYVGISLNGVLHGAAYIGSSGTVDVDLTPFDGPGVADIVVTAQNRQPYIRTIQVIAPSGPYVILDSYEINDISGNNNGELDAGESVLLGVELINVGPDDAHNVSAALTGLDGYVSITDGTESYGTIAGNNGTVNRPDAFAFTVDPNAPDGHNLGFELTVTGTALDIWTSNFSLPVHAPDLGYVAVAINDAGGNGNGILDPGETATLIVTLVNDGSGQASNVIGVLSETDGFVSISDANGTFGNISSDGGTANNSGDVFIASASSSCPQGHDMTFQIDLDGDLGYAATVYFDVIVGDRGSIFYDDFAYNQGWSGLGGTGEWTIGPAAGGAGSDGYGEPDPAQDHTPTGDNRVLGNDLTSADGDYAASMGQTYWVTSPLIDCTDYTGVIMTYYRWLGVERDMYDNAYFQVYNGASWVTLFENGEETIDETSWNEQYYDLSTYADENPNFRIRFGIGVTDGAWQYCGWNIDDIDIRGYFQGSSDPPDMAFSPSSLADSLAEGETAAHFIRINNYGLGNLRVRFTSSNSWLEFDPAQHDIAPGDSLDFEVTINTTGMAPGNYSGALNFTSNDLDYPTGTIPVSLHIYQPAIYIAQSSIIETLESGEQSSVPLVIANNGAGRLNYSIDYETFDNPILLRSGDTKPISAMANQQKPIGYFPPVPGKTAKPEPYFPPMTLDSGGPDAFGYSWIDSDEPGGPVYSWKNITSVGTLITGLGDDTNVGPFPIGFSFEFYGNTYSSFRFSTNGFISFTSSATEYTNAGIPTNGNEPLNLIAPFWDDLNFNDGGDAYYYSSGDSLIVSYINVAHYSYGGPGPYTFQLILLSNGKIVFQYQDINDPNNSNTIGIQNSTGTIGLQVVFNAIYVHENMAIQFSAGPDWLDVAQAGGYIDPFDIDTVDVLFDAADLEDGDYFGEITVNSNDPVSPSIDIPVTLSVGLDGAVIQLNLTSIVDTVETGETSSVDLIISNVGSINLDYTVEDNRSWISESPDNGTVAPSTADTVTLGFDASVLPEGSYTGTVTVNSNAVNDASISLPVSLVVTGPPVEPDIVVNLAEIVDTVQEGLSAEVELIIGNTGVGELAYTITDNRSWIEADPDNGNVLQDEADSVVITLDALSLAQGIYTGAVTVISNDPDNGDILIPVTLVVIEPASACDYLPGDINGDGNTIGSDITFGVNYFRGIGTPADSCWDDQASRWLYVAGDVNGDCAFIGSDITYYVGYFRGTNVGIHFCPRLPPYEPPVTGIPIKPVSEVIGKVKDVDIENEVSGENKK